MPTETEIDGDPVPDAEAVLAFWFGEFEREDWFAKNDATDVAIRNRFGALHDRLCADAGFARGWAATPRGALAALVVLDQFSRNLYRGQARAFAADPLARDLARTAIAKGFHLDLSLPPHGALFFILPFEHSEALADQDWSCALCAELGDDMTLDYAHQHRDIVLRFGRFPHRNAALARTSTPEEEEFLTQPGSSF